MQHPYSKNDQDDASSLGSGDYGGGSVTSDGCRPFPRIFDAGVELESLCRAEISGGEEAAATLGFPPLCLPIARLLSGNICCVDCGEENADVLRYASIGYGTMLCRDCATRHATESGEESNVRHLGEEHWSLRSALAILEGGNTRMLDYVKHKPRWRPPKGRSNESYPEDILAFKQVYLSDAAAKYRKNLARRVDAVFHDRIAALRREDAAKEEMSQVVDVSCRDPFQRIFERNKMSMDEIPVFFNSDSPQANDAGDILSRGGRTAFRYDGGGVLDATGRFAGPRKGRNMPAPLMKEAPNIDLIKQRINMRRAMNSTIKAQAALESDEPWRT